MKAALKYPVFYLAPVEHMVYVFWREENVTTRRQLANDFRQAVYGCRSFEKLARMFRCRPEEEPSIRRVLVRFLVVALVVGLVVWLLARYT